MEFNYKKSVKILFLSFLFLIYTQVYPYVHLHLFEKGHESSIKISTHPIFPETDRKPDHKHNHHQHDENDSHFIGDWEYLNIKTLQNIQIDFPVFFFSPFTSVQDFEEVKLLTYTEPRVIPLLFRIPSSERAPPLLS